LAPLAAPMRLAGACVASGGLDAALFLAPPAPAVRDAMLRAAFSPLEAAVVLAPLAPAVRDAIPRIASSGLEAALLLAPPAPSMRLAALRAACNSRLGAAVVLTALASAMRHAVGRAATRSRLGAALQLALPPAHGTPPGTRHADAAETQLQLRRAFTATTHPLSVLVSPLVDTIHTTVAVREQVRRCSMYRSTALGRGTYGGCVVGQGGQGVLRTIQPQVRSLLVRRAASPHPLTAGSNTPHSTPLHGVHSTTEGHLGVLLLF
jgi:hypothetical protein